MSEEVKKGKCNGNVEVYQRVTGFFRPVQTYNKGKQEEFKDRVSYKEGII
jgi:ribonucleoside-triphosphate reductase